MAFEWSPKRIQWYLDASRYGNFHKHLAGVIKPFLLSGDRLCDLGCGLGRLDLELADAVEHITCVDIHQPVIANLQQEAAKAGIFNLSAQCCDVKDINAGFDVVIMAFFGYPPQLMFDCMNLTDRLLVRIVNAGVNRASLHPDKHTRKRETVQDIALALDNAGCPYQFIKGNFEFGQPLKSVEDAEAFIRCNNPAVSGIELESFLKKNLIDTGHDNSPYYLPGKKELGIFIIYS